MDSILAVKKWLIQHQEIKLALLFGSFARKQERLNSDLDLAVECESKLSSEQKLKLIHELIIILKREVDLIDLKTIGQPLLGRIIQEGKRLKGKHTDYVNLSIRNVNMNEDFLPYIERVQKERREHFLNG